MQRLPGVVLLGEPSLHQASANVTLDDFSNVNFIDKLKQLQETQQMFRSMFGFGRAMAAPQIGNFIFLLIQFSNRSQ